MIDNSKSIVVLLQSAVKSVTSINSKGLSFSFNYLHHL